VARIRKIPRQRKQQRWLVRIDPEIWIDAHFARHLNKDTRYAYFDSLFFLAGADGPTGIYPQARLAAEFGPDATRVEAQLLAFGLWTIGKGGFTVSPYNGCRVVPEQRMPIPRALRRAVMARDGHRCVQCGTTESLSLDHIHPWSLGGPDTYENLRVLCRSCNSSKGAKI